MNFTVPGLLLPVNKTVNFSFLFCNQKATIHIGAGVVELHIQIKGTNRRGQHGHFHQAVTNFDLSVYTGIVKAAR